MLYSEFTELTGVQVTPEEYAAIEEEYMACPDTKNEFCGKWLQVYNKRKKAEAKQFRKEHSIDRLFAFMNGVVSLGGHLTRYDFNTIDKEIIASTKTEGAKLYWVVRPTGTELFLYNIELLQKHNASYLSSNDYAQYEITYIGDGCWDIKLINKKITNI